jgi:hypothetical protein
MCESPGRLGLDRLGLEVLTKDSDSNSDSKNKNSNSKYWDSDSNGLETGLEIQLKKYESTQF